MTTYEKIAPLGKGDILTFCYHGAKKPVKVVNGVVTSVCSEGFSIVWEHTKDEHVYEFCKVEIVGSNIFGIYDLSKK